MMGEDPQSCAVNVCVMRLLSSVPRCDRTRMSENAQESVWCFFDMFHLGSWVYVSSSDIAFMREFHYCSVLGETCLETGFD